MNDRNAPSDASKGHTRTARFVAVNGFRPYEGMGRALATAYSVHEQSNLPEDMVALLRKLDGMQPK